jgi:hypothetical protein
LCSFTRAPENCLTCNNKIIVKSIHQK